MEYFTPIKDISNLKATRTTGQTREGDWVCLNCNNLNFSFRKRCNRCKTQTRSQNESTNEAYSLYYYKGYPYLQKKDPSHNTSANSKPQITSSHSPYPQGELENLLMTPVREGTPKREREELPSVSPLIKRYNEGSMSRLSDNSESLWGVEVRDFAESEEEDG